MEYLTIFPHDKRYSVNPFGHKGINLSGLENLLLKGLKGGKLGDYSYNPMMSPVSKMTDGVLGPLLGSLATSILPVVASFIIGKIMKKKKGETKGAETKQMKELEIVNEIVDELSKNEMTNDAKSILHRVIGRGMIEI